MNLKLNSLINKFSLLIFINYRLSSLTCLAEELIETEESIIGYQNPHEEYDDIRKDKPLARSQVIGHRWPKTGIALFYPANTYSPEQECLLKLAVKTINKYSCIPIRILDISQKCAKSSKTLTCILSKDDQFNTSSRLKAEGIEPNKTMLKDYILINKPEKGCNSDIGKEGNKQTINLSNRCFNNGAGSSVHEMLHSLGYNHEHARLDRDSYISLNKSNIPSDRLHNFSKGPKSEYKDYGPYDFGSIMHYSAYAFAKDRKYRSIIIKEEKNEIYYKIGQRKMLTNNDKAKIRAVTRCPGSSYDEHLKQVEEIEKKGGADDMKAMEAKCK